MCCLNIHLEVTYSILHLILPFLNFVSHSTAKCYFHAQGNRSKGKNLHLSEEKGKKKKKKPEKKATCRS